MTASKIPNSPILSSQPNPSQQGRGLTAGLYVRVSTMNQVDKDSLKTQESRLRAYCQANGYEVREEFVYRDKGMSGKDIDRPELERLMEDCKKGRVHVVLVSSLERITRSIRDFIKLIDFFLEHKIRFVSISQNFDSDNPFGRFMRDMFVLLARLERETVAQRVATDMHHRASLGKWNGGNTPYGYTTYGRELSRLIKSGMSENRAREKAAQLAPEPKKLCMNPEEAKVVKRIFETFISTKSIRKTVDSLNSSGVKPRSGRKWAVATVHKILNSPVCTGKISYGKTRTDLETGRFLKVEKEGWKVVPGEHTPIIPEKLFDSAQEILRSRSRKPTRASHSYLLSGLLRCGKCGGPMHGASFFKKSSGKEYSYYKCQNNETKGPSVCTGLSFPSKRIDGFVVKELMDLYKDKAFLQHKEKTLAAMKKSLKPEKNRETLQALKSAEKDLGKKVETLMEGWESGLFEKADFTREYEKLKAQLKENRFEQERLSDTVDSQEAAYEARRASFEEIASFGKNWEFLDDRSRASKISMIVQDITPSEDDNLHFRLFVEEPSTAVSRH